MGVHRPHRHGRYFVLIVDHDNERFTIEGPVFDRVPWMLEIERASGAGRQIDFRIIKFSRIIDVSKWANDLGYELWPPKSIIFPSNDTKDDVDRMIGGPRGSKILPQR
jgi:hypothetical protein